MLSEKYQNYNGYSFDIQKNSHYYSILTQDKDGPVLKTKKRG